MEKTDEILPSKISFSPNIFLFITSVFFCMTIYLACLSIRRFESSIIIDIWKIKYSLINIALSIIFAALSLSVSRIQLNMAFFWIFQYIFFDITGLLTQIDPFPYYLAKISSDSDQSVASQLIFIAQLFAGIGQIIQIWNTREPKHDFPEMRDWVVRRILSRTYMLLCFYFLAAPLIVYQFGGLSFLLKRVRVESLDQNLSVSINAILQSLLYVPPIVALMLLMYLQRFVVVPRILKNVLLLWILLLSNPLANARQTTLFLIFPLAFFFVQTRKMIAMFLLLVMPLFFVYSADLVNRYTGKIQSPQFSLVSRDGDFDSFAQVANGLKVVSEGGFALFRQLVASLLFFVPRSIYEAKPYDTGIELARHLGLKFQNLSAPWILEAYVNARLPGVILVSFLLGYHLTKVDLYSKMDLKHFLLGSLISGFLFIVLRGSLLQATGRAVFSVGIIYLLCRGLKEKSSV